MTDCEYKDYYALLANKNIKEREIKWELREKEWKNNAKLHKEDWYFHSIRVGQEVFKGIPEHTNIFLGHQ